MNNFHHHQTVTLQQVKAGIDLLKSALQHQSNILHSVWKYMVVDFYFFFNLW